MKERPAGQAQHGYVGEHRKQKDGIRRSGEELQKRRRERRLKWTAAGLFIASIPFFISSIPLNSGKKEQGDAQLSSASTKTNDSSVPEGPLPATPPSSEEKPTPPQVIRTITIEHGQTEWEVSEEMLQQATNDQPTVSETNAATVLIAGINMENGKALNPDALDTGQKLDILTAEAARVIDTAMTHPTTDKQRELGAKLKELNSGGTSIEQTAKEKAALISEIQAVIAAELTETPIFNSVVRDFGLDQTTVNTDQQDIQNVDLSSDTPIFQALLRDLGTNPAIFQADTVSSDNQLQTPIANEIATKSSPTVLFTAPKDHSPRVKTRSKPPQLKKEHSKALKELGKERDKRKKQRSTI